MKKLLFLVFLSLLASGLLAQENPPRPELSKKEIRQYQRKLKKLNKSLQKKTSKLRRFLEEQGVKVPSTDLNLPTDSLAVPDAQLPDSLKGRFQDYQDQLKGKIPDKNRLPVTNAEEAKRKLATQINNNEQANQLTSQITQNTDRLGRLRNQKPTLEQLGELSPMGEEINELKQKLELGKKFAKTDPKTALRVEESLIELVDLEYDMKDLDSLKSRFKNLKLDSSAIKRYIEPLTGDISELKAEVGEYQTMLDGYKNQLKDWDKTLEKEIMELEEVQRLSQEIKAKKPVDLPAKKEEVEQTIDKGYQSSDYITNLIKGRFDKLIKEKGPGVISERLRDGHQQLSELKQKYNSLDSIGKAGDNRNPLRENSFTERLVFGGNFQVNRQRPLTLDAGLEVAYRLTLKSEWGLGGAYRLKLGKGKKPETVTDVLNFRSFYHHKVWKSLGLQANYELNYAIPRTIQVVENPVKQWQESALIGIRNEQPFSKKLGGYVTLQYDLLYKVGSPSSKWLFRFAFRL